MFKTTIYRLFLALLLVLVPIAGAGQQNVDIKKPTRERVKDKDKSSPKDNKAQAKDKTSKDNKAQAKDKTSKDNTKDKAKESSPAKNDKNADAAADKSSSKKDTPKKDAPKKDDTKKDAPKKDDVKKDAPKKDDTKKDAPKASQLVSTPDDKTAAKQPVADTATKKPEPPKRPVKQPVNPDKVKYDGIDISSHQGNIKWAELKKNTALKFIYIKATEGGNFRDQMYAENFRNARKQGFKVGSYHF